MKIDGFQPIFRKDRNDRQWGGVGAYISNSLGATRRFDLELNQIEALWLEIRCLNKKFLLCVCYRPPDQHAQFWEYFQESMDLAKQTGIVNIIIAGDLNADPVKNRPVWNKLNIFTIGNNFKTHITEPTRVTNATATCLDQFISNFEDCVQNTTVLDPVGSSDHCTISIELRISIHKQKTYKRLMWNFKNANFDTFRNNLRDADWDSCFEFNSII